MARVQCGNYMLFVLDNVQKQLIVLDPNPLPFWALEIPCKRYFHRMHGIAINYGNDMRVRHPDYYENVFQRQTLIPHNDVPKCTHGFLTGHLVLQMMGAWNNGQETQFCMEDSQLRRNLLIDLLTYEGNSYRFAIPENIRHYLTRIIDTQI
ncbi:hypothetical protein ACP4OV_021680 [Aristida adscensionis]